ncbi:GntR family transcriptional regulator [Microbacterium halotolerans]|uniref:GntR family transcriptional regulator n=1 Tax=Microbacterium halotolerans TaxID=246613 RepID=UPI000E6AB474|nr:GntR family transcriptional regulator [Microbacterium halotolerans]
MHTTPRGAAAQYRRIALILWDEIRAGGYTAGERLPAEHELSSRFEVNRLTVRQAIAELQKLGIVQIRRGSGTFVAEPPSLVEIVSTVPARAQRRDSVHAALLGSEEDNGSSEAASVRVTERIDSRAADDSPTGRLAAGHLGMTVEELVRIDSVMFRSGQPWIVNSYWMPTRLGERAASVREGETVVTTLRAAGDIALVYLWRAFSATAADFDEADLLGADVGSPLLVRDGVTADADGKPVFYVRRRMRGEHAKFVLRYVEDSDA